MSNPTSVEFSPIETPIPSNDLAPPTNREIAIRWLPAIIAVLFFVAFSAIVLSQPEKMIEPDPYAYRASIAALEDGNITLDQSQYDALSTTLQQTSLGGGIMQWHQNDNGTWVSEKNPGYPFLAVGFDEAGALRLAPLFYGALACLALWFGARRWLGHWGGTFAIGAYCSTALAMVMAWRSTMPTFTDASLVAVGLGLLIWSVVALDRSHRARSIVGALAFLTFGLATFVRYTNIVVLGVAALFALAVCLRPKWKLGLSTLIWWAIASIPPLIASLVYNAVVFDGPFSTGYNASTVQFSTSAVPDNFRIMPSRLWQAMPIFVVGLLAIVVLVAFQIMHALRVRSEETTGNTELVKSDTETTATAISATTIDRWVGIFLIFTWAATWATYAAYEWTANMGGGRPTGGGFGGGALPGGAMSAMSQPVYSTVRFYLPALGAIALLVAWLFTRVPAAIGVVALIALFAFGGHEFRDTVNSQWASMSMSGGRGAFGGPQQFDLSKCSNLPQMPQGAQNQNGGPPAGGLPNRQQSNGVPNGLPGTPPNGAQGRGELTLDESGCPVLPGANSSGSTTTSTIPVSTTIAGGPS